MKLKSTIFVMFFLIPLLANCQTNTNDSFAKYSAKQDSMMVDAYTKRDASLYGDLLNQFVYRYNELNEPDKKQFKQYLFRKDRKFSTGRGDKR